MKKIKINIPEPCHENWDTMTPVAKGKFCASCKKTVLDFTHASDYTIYQAIKENDNLCGRFRTSQLNRNLVTHSTHKQSWIKYIIATAVVSILSLWDAKAQGGIVPKIEQTDSLKQKINNNSVPVKLIKGVVIDEQSKKPLPFTKISIYKSNNITTTDANGKFKLRARESDILVFELINYQTQYHKVSDFKGILNMNINMEIPSNETLGKVMIKHSE